MRGCDFGFDSDRFLSVGSIGVECSLNSAFATWRGSASGRRPAPAFRVAELARTGVATALDSPAAARTSFGLFPNLNSQYSSYSYMRKKIATLRTGSWKLLVCCKDPYYRLPETSIMSSHFLVEAYQQTHSSCCEGEKTWKGTK